MEPTPTDAVSVELDGHLTLASLGAALHEAESRLRRDEPVMLIVDCRTMSGYDGDARTEFVRWNARHRKRIRAVAVITEKTLWHLVVSAMALASGQKMKAFNDLADAKRWIAAGTPSVAPSERPERRQAP